MKSSFELDLELDCFVSTFTPNKIVDTHTRLIFQDVPESVKVYARELVAKSWRFFAVDQKRGFCNDTHRVIAIPVWAIDKKPLDYKIWYVSHELSHAYAGCKYQHGPEFMKWLKQICPTESIHHELGYKPRNAKAAGIMLL